MSIWSELRRRNVFKVAVAYLVASWLIVQVIIALTEPLSLPDSLDTIVIVLLAIFLPIALLLAWVFEVTPEGVKRTADSDGAVPVAAARGQRLNTVVTILLALIVVTLVVDNYILRGESAATGIAGQPVEFEATVDLQGPPYRIAVLPLRSVSRDPQDNVFADGLTIELISRLGQVSEFILTGATSSFAFSERAETVPAIARELAVDFVLEGDVRLDADQLRVTVRLVDAMGESSRSLGPYNRPRGQELELQDEIAAEVAAALSVSLGVAADRGRGGWSDNSAAIDAFLRGRALHSALQPFQAIEAYQRAVDLDPDFGLAWVGYVESLGLALVFDERNEEFRTLRDRALQRSLETAPDLWQSHALNANYFAGQREWLSAGQEMETALALGPNIDAEWAGFYAGGFLVQVGRIQEGANLYVEGRATDPLSVQYSGATAWALDLAGRSEEALAEFDRHRDLAGGRVQFSGAYLAAALQSGDAMRIEEALSLFDSEMVSGQVASVWQSPESVAEILRANFVGAVAEQFRWDYPAVLAPLAAYHGQTDLALDLLRTAYRNPRAELTVYLWHPIFREARATDGFKDLIRDLGIDAYWRSYQFADACRRVGDDDFACN